MKKKNQKPELRMGGKPITYRIEKSKERILLIEAEQTHLFERNNVRPRWEAQYWKGVERVFRVSRKDARRLSDLQLMRGLHITRYNYYHDLYQHHHGKKYKKTEAHR